MLKRAAVVALSSLALLVPTAAHADVTPPSVTGVKASNLVVTSGSCRDVPITYTLAPRDPWATDWTFSGDVEIWRGSRHVDTDWVYDHDGNRRIQAEYFWCPSDGFGTFRAGPARFEYDYEADHGDEYEWGSGRFNSNKTAAFTVKMGTRFDRVSATKSGSTRTLKARLRYFKAADYTNAWVPFPKGTKVHVQRRVPGGSWKYLKTAVVGSSGALVSKTTASKTYDYRFVYNGAKSLATSGSAAVRR